MSKVDEWEQRRRAYQRGGRKITVRCARCGKSVSVHTDGNNLYQEAGRRAPTLNCQNVSCGVKAGFHPICPQCNDRLKNDGSLILFENGKEIQKPLDLE